MLNAQTIVHRLRQHAAGVDRAAQFVLGYRVGQDSYDEQTWQSFWPDGTPVRQCTVADFENFVQKKVRTLSAADILAKIDEVLHEQWEDDGEEVPISDEERLGMVMGFALKALQEEPLLCPPSDQADTRPSASQG